MGEGDGGSDSGPVAARFAPSGPATYLSTGVSDFYLPNFPQFNQAIVGTNDGRSYYNSFQFSLRRQAGALRFIANYTFSKSIRVSGRFPIPTALGPQPA